MAEAVEITPPPAIEIELLAGYGVPINVGGGGGGGATNLSIANRTTTALDVVSDTGADATVPAATTALAGLMIAADKTKLDTAPSDIGAAIAARELAGTAAASMASHLAAGDPHPQYTTAAEASAAAPVQSVAGRTGAVTLAKSDVGLANVDNTADLAKPISTATQTALDGKAATSHSHADATTGAAGFMSAADKTKLDGIASGATANATDAQLRDRATHTGTQAAATISDLAEAVDDRVAALLQAGSNVTLVYNDAANTLTISAAGGGGATNLSVANRTATALDVASDTGTDATLPAATTLLAGLMVAADKAKLDGIASGATANATDAQLRDRTTHTGTQAASTISDFAEAVDDRVAVLLQAGTNVTLVYNDAANTLTISATGGGGGSAPQLTYIAMANNYYTRRGSGASTTVLAANRRYGLAFFHPGGTVNELAIPVTVASAGSLIRLGLRNVNQTTGQPTTLIVDAGTVDSSTTGLKAITGLGQSVSAGWYMLECTSNGTPTVTALSAPESTFGQDLTAAGVNPIATIFRDVAFGPLAADESANVWARTGTHFVMGAR